MSVNFVIVRTEKARYDTKERTVCRCLDGAVDMTKLKSGSTNGLSLGGGRHLAGRGHEITFC